MGYLSQAIGIHTAQKFQNNQGRPWDQMSAHQQDSNDSYKYLLCAFLFEAHEALMTDGAAVTHSTEEFHSKMNEGLQDLAFPVILKVAFITA